MFARKNTKVTLTFFCLVVALGLATVSEANSLVHNSRDHVDLSRRMVKKPRLDDPFSALFPVNGAEGASASVSTDTSTATTTAATDTSSVADPLSTGLSLGGLSTTSAVTDTTTSASSTSTTDTSSTVTSTSSSTITSSSSSTTSTSTTTSSTPTTTSTSSTDAPAPTTAPATDDTQPSSTFTVTNVVTASDSSATESSTAASSVGATSTSKITRTTLTVIIVIAACIGFIALAWTLFRKWKLRPSSNFDDRMQPIDWQPSGPEDSGIPTHRRNGSHGSFQSSAHGHASGLEPLPSHDFTAGPAALAPVGGYADLQRGPSPQPSMAELSRGPSVTRQQYGGAYDYNGPRY